MSGFIRIVERNRGLLRGLWGESWVSMKVYERYGEIQYLLNPPTPPIRHRESTDLDDTTIEISGVILIHFHEEGCKVCLSIRLQMR